MVVGFCQGPYGSDQAWSRMFALFAIALLVMTTLGSRLLLSSSRARGVTATGGVSAAWPL